MKKLLKCVFRFLKKYLTYTFILFLLNEKLSIGTLLIDGLVFSCVFELVEFLGKLINKRRKKKSSTKENTPDDSGKDDTIVACIAGVSFVILLALRILL